MKRKTTEKFKQEVFDLVGYEYQVLSMYKTARKKIKMKHQECNREYWVRPYSFLAGNRCPHCNGTFKKTTKQFKAEVKKKVGDKYEIIGKYVNAKTKIKMKHKDCNEIYMVTPDDFLNQNTRCPYCYGTKKKTTKEFIEEISNLYNNEYKVLGDYKNAHTKILVQHKCGYKYKVKPNNLLNNKSCPECARESSRKKQAKNTKQFINEVKEQVKDKYTVLGKYINAKTKVKMKHNECSHIYVVTPDQFLNNQTRCPKCFSNSKKTTSEYKEQLHAVHGNEYKVLSDYKGNKQKIFIEHTVCGWKWYTLPYNLLKGHGCPKCSGNLPSNTEEFKEKVYKLEGNKYIVLGPYINADTPIKLKHKISSCGYEWETPPKVFLKGHRCPKCAGIVKKTTESFKQEIYDLEGDKYSVIGNYINTNTPIRIIHNECGHEFKPYPYSFLSGTRCPRCASSKIEKLFIEFLENIGLKRGLDYNHNTIIPGCKLDKHLRFDFQIYVNEEEYYLIEFDGQFHYKNIMGIEQLKLQVKRDFIKDEFCLDNNIKLIRIPYWEFQTIKNIIQTYEQKLLRQLIVKDKFKKHLEDNYFMAV
ncbi:MAG: hypothetical protein ACLFMO_07610 [Eubacteriales bacterium]